MKKLILCVIVCVLLSTVSYATDFVNVKQVTLSWDAVTQDVDGDPALGATYRLYLANADTDPGKTNPVIVHETSGTTATITMSKGRFFVGVDAVYLGDSSVINWADEPANQGTSPLFGLRYASPPKAPVNLRTP